MRIKKEALKGFCIGVVAAITVMGTTIVYGDPIRKQVYAVYNDIKIVVDGKEITPKDGNGKVVEPFIVDGTTYLPVRALANALGKSVDWDSATDTVYIGGKFLTDAVGLEKLVTIAHPNGNYPVRTGAKLLNRGEEILSDNSLEGRNQFILDGKYKSMTGQFVVPDKGQNNVKLTFTNMDTDEVIAEFTNSVNEKPIPVVVNLIGVDKLRIETSSYAFLFNAEFHPLATQ